MRLKEREIRAITDTAAAVFGPDASVRLFGSRVDDSLTGGDIDLYVEVEPGRRSFAKESRFRVALGDRLGDEKIDVVVHERGEPLRPIDRLAETTGVSLSNAGTTVQPPDQVENRGAELTDLAKEFLVEAVAMADAVAVRLRRSQERLGHLFPVSAADIGAMTEDDLETIDALIKRVENLQDILQRRVFRALLMAEGEAVRGEPAPAIAERLEARGAIASAAQWKDLADLRNRLAHDYPLHPDIQADRINGAYAAIAPLIGTLDQIRQYIARTSAPDAPG
jgi:predicted nucleotidyltransferase